MNIHLIPKDQKGTKLTSEELVPMFKNWLHEHAPGYEAHEIADVGLQLRAFLATFEVQDSKK